MQCPRCGDYTPLFTKEQKRCARCEREVAAIVEQDTRRRTRFERPKDLTRA
jgi:uncharacterized Zn finger protein (UPF0148 family)